MMRARAVKLYVWRDVLEDYTPGVIAVMATSEDAARKKVARFQAERHGKPLAPDWCPDLVKEIEGKTPDVLDARDAVVFCSGGG
jgi:hypothetical protein